MAREERPVLSVVIPCFNEAPNIAYMSEQLTAVLEEIGESFEILWVNDGSSDESEAELDALAAADPRHRALHLSRNFGHMAALTAGLEQAEGTGAVICMDGDGQHPPELLPELVRLWRDGAELVQTIRMPSEEHETAFKRSTSGGFYKLLNFLGDIDLPDGAADFRLMSREMVDALNRLPERDRFIRALVHWVGFRREYLPYKAPERRAGVSKYTFFKMLRLALSGLTSFSTRPLRLSFLLGAIVTGLAFLYAVYILICYFAGIDLVPGWTSMLLALLVLSGIQLLTLGIASEYLARLYMEQKQRPVYILRAENRRSDDERHND